MTEAKNKAAAIYTSIAEVLKALSVEKTGQLPGNMGGKSYITAVDASAEVKRQFVKNNIVIFPCENQTHYEVLVDGNGQKTIVVSIEGTYKLVSTLDGSSEVVSAAGDGIAKGTAVASNIASTNALKNALLRTFLITEQSVEDAAKNGPADVPVPDTVKNAVAKRDNGKAYDELLALTNDPDSKVTKEHVKEVTLKVAAENKGLSAKDRYAKVLEIIKAEG